MQCLLHYGTCLNLLPLFQNYKIIYNCNLPRFCHGITNLLLSFIFWRIGCIDTMLPNKDFHSVKQGFLKHKARKIGKIGFLHHRARIFPTNSWENHCLPPKIQHLCLQCGRGVNLASERAQCSKSLLMDY